MVISQVPNEGIHIRPVFEKHVKRIIDSDYLNSNADAVRNGLDAGYLTLKDVKLNCVTMNGFRCRFRVLSAQAGCLSLCGFDEMKLVFGSVFVSLSLSDNPELSRLGPNEGSSFHGWNHGPFLTELLAYVAQYFFTELPCNMRIEIQSLEVRLLHDGITSNSAHYSYIPGFTLSSLTVTTPPAKFPESGHFQYLNEESVFMNIEGFSIYLDESQSIEKTPLDLKLGYSSNHSYITSQNNLTVEASLGHGVDNPLMTVNLNCAHPIHVSLRRSQYQYINTLLERYYLLLKKYHYHPFRPNNCSSLNRLLVAAKTIVNYILERRRRQRSLFKDVLSFAKRRREYAEVWMKAVSRGTRSQEMKELHRLERGLSRRDVSLFRYLATRSYRHSNPSPHLCRGREPTTPPPQLRINFTANSVSIMLHMSTDGNSSENLERICKLNLDRPVMATNHHADDTADFTFASTSLQIMDETLLDNGFPVLLQLDPFPTNSNHQVNSTTLPGLSIHITRAPSHDVDRFHTLDVHAGPTQLIYDRSRVEAAYHFFKGEDKCASLLEISLGALLTPQFAFGNNGWDIKVKVERIKATLPEDVASKAGAQLEVQMGPVTVSGHYSKASLKNRIDNLDNDAFLYDSLTLKINSVWVTLQDGTTAHSTNPSHSAEILKQVDDLKVVLEILKDTSLHQSCKLPLFKISACPPKLVLAFSDTTYRTFARLIREAIPRLKKQDNGTPSGQHALPKDIGVIPLDFTGVSDDSAERGGANSIANNNNNERTRVEVGNDTVDMIVGDIASNPDSACDSSPAMRVTKGAPVVHAKFQVDELEVSLWERKGNENDPQRNVHEYEHLCDIVVRNFVLSCVVARKKKIIVAETGTINVHAPRLSQHPSTPIALLPVKIEGNNPTSQVEVDDAPRSLLSLSFTSTEPTHHDFIPLHHGYPQDVRISLAPAVFQGALEPVVVIWSLLMAMLKPEDANVKEEPGDVSLLTNLPQRNKMRIGLNLTKVQVLLDLHPEKEGKYTKLLAEQEERQGQH